MRPLERAPARKLSRTVQTCRATSRDPEQRLAQNSQIGKMFERSSCMHVVEASIMIGGLPAEQCCGIPGNVLQLIGPRSPSSWVAFHVGWVGTGNKAGATLPPSTSWHGCAAARQKQPLTPLTWVLEFCFCRVRPRVFATSRPEAMQATPFFLEKA